MPDYAEKTPRSVINIDEFVRTERGSCILRRKEKGIVKGEPFTGVERGKPLFHLKLSKVDINFDALS